MNKMLGMGGYTFGSFKYNLYLNYACKAIPLKIYFTRGMGGNFDFKSLKFNAIYKYN